MRFLRNLFPSRHVHDDISCEDVFLDAHNLPKFDVHQYEGRLSRRLGKKSALTVICIFICVVCVFTGKLWSLQVVQGDTFALKSENNHVNQKILYPERGIIYDRNNKELAWNRLPEDEDFSRRMYTASSGFAHVLGYVSYPKKDIHGVYYEEEYKGVSGAEYLFDSELSGIPGIKIIETDALSQVQSEGNITSPVHGRPVTLSIDARIQTELYNQISKLAQDVDFQGGAGAIMDVRTGELIALTSYPEFSSQIMSDRSDTELIQGYFDDEHTPFLNRITQGLYTPGSIVKPFMALAALHEGVVSMTHQILSTGQMSVPNPYNPSNPSIFTDWRAHGLVDVIDALAVSSNIYFYQVGGGYQGKPGLGIDRIEQYIKAFGIGNPTGIRGFSESEGVVPNPLWKKEVFDGEDWRLGDTYLTSIGQYGFQVTPLQMLRAVSAIAREGVLVTPSLKKGGENKEESISLDIPKETYHIVERGMREAVLRGTAKALDVPYMEIAAKTGTAEVGISKKRVNSWVIGFFPYREPKYAFVVMMEKGPRTNLTGSAVVMRWLLDWMKIHTPEYIDETKIEKKQEVFMNTADPLPEIELPLE